MSHISTLMQNQDIPKLKTAIMIVHGCLQALEHGYIVDKAYDLYDEYVENGGMLMNLIMALVKSSKSGVSSSRLHQRSLQCNIEQKANTTSLTELSRSNSENHAKLDRIKGAGRAD